MPPTNEKAIRIHRREFLKAATLAGTAGLLASCAPAVQPTPTPAATPIPPTATPDGFIALRKPELMKMYPDAPSKVIHAHHAAAWQGKSLNRDALRQMLDESMKKLTGVTDAREAWAGLFAPDEIVGIKVNAFLNSLIWTHVPLTAVVVASLVDAGIPAGQILIFDQNSSELTTAGFREFANNAGVQCAGSDYQADTYVKVAGNKVGLSPRLLETHALINMPVLKSHMITGMTFALKNHFGTVENPEALHYPFTDTLAALNALPEIKDRTRLVVGDALEACLKYADYYPYWKADYTGDSILVSHDPVAVDAVAGDYLGGLMDAAGLESGSTRQNVVNYTTAATKLGVGASEPAQMSVDELRLS